MILTRITLHNYSAFEGTQGVSLCSASENDARNITLIGAMNGSGKTSLLEAVRLCLYGERFSGLLPPRDSPIEFVLARFNANARERREAEMWIELELDEIDLPGNTHQLQIRRTWKFNSVRGTYEGDDFSLSREGKPLQIIGREHWQDFINESIPPGVAGFFFFDGEKIQQLADDQNDRDTLRDAIRNLLGLSVYSRLGVDLSSHTDTIRRGADRATDAQLKGLEAIEARLLASLEKNAEEREERENELHRVAEDEEVLHSQVRRVTGVGADSRDDLQREIAQLEVAKRTINDEVMRVACDLMPFAITGRLCDDLRAQLEGEEKLRSWQASKERVHPHLNRIVSQVFFAGPQPKPDISPTQRTFYAHRLTEEWETLFLPKPLDAAQSALHELSPKDERLILGTLDKVSAGSLAGLEELLRRREDVSRRLNDAQRSLRILPEDNSHLAELFDRKRQSDERKAGLNRDLGRLADEATRDERELASIREKIRTLLEHLKQANVEREKVALSRKVQSALQRFEKALQERKLEELENHTTEMYRRLARKGDFVGRVRIDPRTFEVTVEDPRGHVREKKSLSAGEKQIYAIALLWGLARSSNVSLPVMVDTPFARLDSEHRANIARHYFPFAGEQVVVLSTDEEVDHRHVELLRPHIGRTYLIEHNDAERRSVVKDGYFGGKEPL